MCEKFLRALTRETPLLKDSCANPEKYSLERKPSELNGLILTGIVVVHKYDNSMLIIKNKMSLVLPLAAWDNCCRKFDLYKLMYIYVYIHC